MRLSPGAEEGLIETGDYRANLRWAWVLTLVIGALDWIWAVHAGVAFVGWFLDVCILTFLLAIGFRYSKYNRRLSDAGNYTALWMAFSAAAAILTYLCATLGMPLRDTQFVALDAMLGFHWLAWSRFIGAHRVLEVPLVLVYDTFLPQIVGSILYFAHTEQTGRNAEMIWIAMLSVIVTAFFSALLPAVGPLATIGQARSYSCCIRARYCAAGCIHSLHTISAIQGIMNAVSSLKIRISTTTPTSSIATAHKPMTIALEWASARSPILSNFAINSGSVKPNNESSSAH